MKSPGFVVGGRSLIHPLGVGQLAGIPGVREAQEEKKMIHGDADLKGRFVAEHFLISHWPMLWHVATDSLYF